MKKILALVLVLLATSTSLLVAQTSLKKPTLEHLMPGGDKYLYTENIYGLDWWGDTCVQPKADKVVAIHPKTGQEKVLFHLTDINAYLQNENLPKLAHLYQVSFPEAYETKINVQVKDELISINWKSGEVKVVHKLKKEAKHIDYSPKQTHIAYTIGRDLWVDNEQLTTNPEGVVAGQTVHRSEFGINKGTFWSPSGNLLAFYEKDERMVTDYPHVDINSRIASLQPTKYPMAGMASHKVTVGIYQVHTNQTVYLETGDPTDRFFTNISWAPDEKSVYLIELNRDQNQAQLKQFDAVSGRFIRTLYEESHPKYVEPQNPIQFLPWNKSQFIYQSEKDGFNHIYLFNTKGDILRQLTKGEWVVQSVVGFNTKRKELIITATKYSPLQSNLLAISTQTGQMRSLDNQTGVHKPHLSSSGEYIIDNYSSPSTPRAIDLLHVNSNKRLNLLLAKDPYNGYVQPDVKVGTIKAADGKTDLYYRLVQAKNLDKSKKHPVIVYVYGGPHAQMINASWNYGTRGWDIYMANKGYIVFTLDNRGSDNRGLEFENCTFRELGIKEGEDQVEGLKFLAKLGYADMSRVGVHGWSFGGHMTTALMLRYPDLFKVGVAGGSVINWAYYEIMYGERYMDTPQANPEGYKKTNLCNYADQLKGRLLMIHDDLDPVCVPQHTLSFIKSCIESRTYPDLFIYPGHLHNVLGRDRVHLYEKITRYFEDYL